MTRRDRSRRRFLAAVGATASTVALSALAGCAALPGSEDDQVDEVHASRLPDVEHDPALALAATYPVSLPQSHFRRAQARTNDALESVPTPLGSRRIPNGHVRSHLADAVAEARDHLDDALDAPTPRSALHSLRRARSHARYADAGWAAITDDRDVDAVRADAEAVRDRAREEATDHDYVGTDPVSATVAHAGIETLFGRATSDVDGPTHDDPLRVLQVADYAADAERARAALDDAVLVRDRFRAAQPDDAGSVEPAIRRAVDALADRIQAARESLPDRRDALTVADADIENTPAQAVLDDLYRRATFPERPREFDESPANAVVTAVRTLAATDAYLTERARIEDGTRYDLTSAEDVVTAYDRSHVALETAPADSSAPGLASAALESVAYRVRFTDERIADNSNMVNAYSLQPLVVDYTAYAAIAESVPTAVDTAVDVLRD